MKFKKSKKLFTATVIPLTLISSVSIAPILFSCSNNQPSNPTPPNNEIKIDANELFNLVNNFSKQYTSDQLLNNSKNQELILKLESKYNGLDIFDVVFYLDPPIKSNTINLKITTQQATKISLTNNNDNVMLNNNELTITNLVYANVSNPPPINPPQTNKIMVDATNLWNEMNAISSKYTYDELDSYKQEFQSKIKSLVLNISLSDLTFHQKGNNLKLEIITNQEKELEIKNSNTNVWLQGDETIIVDNLTLKNNVKPPSTIEKIDIDTNKLFNELNNLTKTITINEFESKKSEFIKLLKSNSSTSLNILINITDVVCSLTTNKAIIKFSTKQEDGIKLTTQNNNVILEDDKKTIIVNNLDIKKTEINLDVPSAPGRPNNVSPSSPTNTGQLKVERAEAKMSSTNFVVVQIIFNMTPPTDHSKYKFYFNDKEVNAREWMIPEPNAINSPILQIEQANGLAANQYIRIEVDGASTGNLFIEPYVVEYQEPVLGDDYFIAPWCPSGKEDNPKYWIVNPYTRNKWIIDNFGNIPLPMIANTTKEDYFNLFTTYALNMYSGSLSFGKRKVDSEELSNEFVKWTIEMGNYFPYFSFNNESLRFQNSPLDVFITEQDVNTPTHIFEAKRGIYEKELIKQGPKFDKFNETVQMFFNAYYRPGMSDLDKVVAAFFFTVHYVKYNGNNYSNISHYISNEGVCNNYSQMMSQILRAIGVPAIAMTTNPNDHLSHSIVWIYMDIGDGRGKKWYGSDPTYSDTDIGFDDVYGHPISYQFPFNSTLREQFIVYDIARNSDYFDDISWDLEHENFFEYQGSKWYTPFKEEKISDQGWTLGWNNIIKNPAASTKIKRSRLTFYDGWWYFLQIKDNGYKELYRGNLKTGETQIVTDGVPNQYKELIFNNSSYYIGLAQFGDNLIFINDQDYGANKKIYIHNMRDTNWEYTKEISIDSWKDVQIINFYVNAKGELVLSGSTTEWSNSINKTETFSLTSQIFKDINKAVKTINEDVIQAKQYFDFLAGYVKIGDLNFNSTIQQKRNYYINAKQIFDNSKTNDQKIIELMNNYNNYVKVTIKGELANITNSIYPQRLVIDESAFNQYGFDLPQLFYISTLQELQTYNNESMRYDIYYSSSSSNKESMQLLVKGSSANRIDKTMFKKINQTGPKGYYYIKYYIYELEQTTSKETNVFEIDVSQNEYISQYPKSGIGIGTNEYFSKTNVTNYPGWDERNININLNVDSTYNDNQISWELKHMNLKKQLNIIDNGTGKICSYNIGAVDDSKAGIYYFKVKIVNNGNTYTYYSAFNFVLTKQNATEFDSDTYKWNELVDEIIKNEINS